MEMLKEMISEFSEVYLVLDSIDSCTAPTKLLDFIDELSKWRQGHLHLLTANSSDPLFAEKLLESANTEICVGHLPPNFKANIVNQLELLRSQGGVSVEKVLAWITMAPCPVSLSRFLRTDCYKFYIIIIVLYLSSIPVMLTYINTA
jgi:hypothetical protein